MAPGRRPTMADVAQRAGVSIMTVSRVLNGFAGVAPETRRRVEDSVAALGYRANTAARVLAGGRSRALGVIAVGETHVGPLYVLYGIEASARAAGHVLNFVSLDLGSDDLRGALDHLRAAQVEGVVVLAPVRRVVEALGDLPSDLPLVVAGGDPSVSRPTVTVDQEGGARLATRHLLDLGHRTVHHVRGDVDWIDAEARVRGWESALRGAGAPVVPCLQGDWSAAGGYEQGRRLAADPEVSAIFAANDQTATGVLRALHEAGRAVPGDVSVVGFDDTPEAGYLLPPLTTVRQDLAEVGRRAVELLLTQVEGEERPEHVVVPPELVVRASTARAA